MEDASIWSRCENVFNAALTGVLRKGATATWPAALGPTICGKSKNCILPVQQ